MPGITINDDSNCTEKKEEPKIVNKVRRQLILLRCKFHLELYGMKNFGNYKNSVIIKLELPHCERQHKVARWDKGKFGLKIFGKMIYSTIRHL